MINFEEKEGKEYLNKLKNKGEKISFAVIGAGNGGMAMAGHLAIMGYPVNIYNRTIEKLKGIQWHGGIKIDGEVSGFGKLQIITTKIEEAIKGVDIIMVVIPATGHGFIAKECAPYLKNGQIIILNPGRTGGTLEFRKVLIDIGVNKKIFLAETQTLIYAARTIGPAFSKIFRIKNKVPMASLPAYWIPDIISIINPAFPQFIPADNVLKTSLDNIGAVFHPSIMLFNMSWIEKTEGDFEFYIDGISKALSYILEKVDEERIKVAEALGILTISAKEWLYRTYGSWGDTLFEAIKSTTAYKGIKAPENINSRYIWEDIPTSLVPIASIGETFKTPTPTIKSIIDIASIVHKKDYWKEGRTAEKLGLTGLSLKEILQMITS